MINPSTQTERTTVRRIPDRGHYDRPTIDAILDEAMICHVGFIVDGQPYVIPMVFARVADDVYLHGSVASRLMRTLRDGCPVCVTVTLLDGLVLARSAFDHSMNYRSVVILGTPSTVDDPFKKEKVLRAMAEHLIPGRWDDVRKPTEQELKATTILRVPLSEASAKIRTGPPKDDEADYELPVWAGVIPLHVAAEAPVPDPVLRSEIPTPEYAIGYSGPVACPEQCRRAATIT